MVVAHAGYQGKRRYYEQLAGNGRANAAGQAAPLWRQPPGPSRAGHRQYPPHMPGGMFP
jgi:hypothetical protein